MRKVLWLIVCLMAMVVSANAQSAQSTETKEVFCLLVGHEKFMSKNVSVTIDYGQKVGFWQVDTSIMKLVDEDGKPMKFNSMIDACNYLSSLGWTYVNAYAASSNQGTCYHWLFKKTIGKGEEVEFKTKGNTTRTKGDDEVYR